MDRSRTEVLAFVSDWLRKIKGCRKAEAAYMRIGQRRYLDTLVHTSLLPREHARLSAQMRIYTASGTA
jgi:hypothetical protein